jgi:uncharacterized protein (DUF4415 family)
MAKRKPLTNDEGEVRELTGEDFAGAITFDELPASLRRTLSSRTRGPQKTPTKQLISLRVSQDVLAAFKSDGPGWQTRMDEVLRKSLQRKRA